MNPMQLLKMKSAWDRFRAAHPKFPLFLNSVMQNGIHEGTILEFKVTEPDGRTFCSNLKMTVFFQKVFCTLASPPYCHFFL